MNLAAKIDKLSKSCNDAVFAVDRDKVMDPSDDARPNEDEHEEDEQTSIPENEQLEQLGLDESSDNLRVGELRKKICSWRPMTSPDNWRKFIIFILL